MLLESFFSPMVGAGDNSLREQVFLEFCQCLAGSEIFVFPLAC